jgi:hypothetical protein
MNVEFHLSKILRSGIEAFFPGRLGIDESKDVP